MGESMKQITNIKSPGISKMKSLSAFDLERYKNVSLDHLIIYTLAKLEDIGVDLSFENAVVAAYKLFPAKFSLIGFPDYPDSLRVYTCLWRCSTDRKKLWIGGKIRQGFTLTDKSWKFIEEARNLLEGKTAKKGKALSKTRRKEVILEEMLSSPAYQKYAKGLEQAITEADFCYLLQGTLDSSKDTLRENLESLKAYASELRRDDILKFLSKLEERFKRFLTNKK